MKKRNKKKNIAIIALMCFSINSLPLNVYAVNVTMNSQAKSSTNFDLWGMVGSSRVQTTYGNGGYSTVLSVNGSETQVTGMNSVTYNGITIQTVLTPVSNGSYMQIKYIVRNSSTSSKTIGIATHSDVMIGSNDKAPITKTDRGFTMTGDGYTFNLFGKNSYGVSTNIDTFWFGQYGSRTSNLWNQISSTSLSGVDSGMVFSWKNRTIQPGETQEYSALIGVGDVSNVPILSVTSSLKSNYYAGEIVQIKGTVNDLDKNDVIKIKWAVDNGTEYLIDSSFTPNGTAKDFSLNFSIPKELTAGSHKLDIWAVDSSNNMSVSKSLTFNVAIDNKLPTATHTTNVDTWSYDTVTINVNTNDLETGVKSIQLPNGETLINSSTNLNMNTQYVVSANGTYNFIVTDNYGNNFTYPVVINNIRDLNATIAEATNLVTSSESSKNQNDLDIALNKVNELPDCIEKTNLLSKLNQLQELITKIAEITNLTIRAEETKDQNDLNIAISKLNELPNCMEKANLLIRLNKVQQDIYNLNGNYADRLQYAKDKLDKAQSSKLNTDILVAQTLINKLNETDKALLQQTLNIVKEEVRVNEEQIKYNKLIEDTIVKITKAESTKIDFDVNMAQLSIDKLKPEDKDSLQLRLDNLKEQIRLEQEATNYNKLLEDAKFKVSKAENSKINYDILLAQMSIDKLKEIDKTSLQLRLDNLKEQIRLEQEELNYAKLLEDAELKVAKAEETKNNYDISVAQTAVDKLKPEDKEPLQLRLDILNYNILLGIANFKVGSAESTTTEITIELAQNAINKLPNDAPVKDITFKYMIDTLLELLDNANPFTSDELLNKEELQEKLDRLKQLMEEEKIEQQKIETAKLKVKQAYASKKQVDIDSAKLAIEQLKPSELKTELAKQIKELEDSLAQINIENLIYVATVHVKQAEALRRELYMTKAQASIDKIPDCDDKTNLQNRLDSVIVRL